MNVEKSLLVMAFAASALATSLSTHAANVVVDVDVAPPPPISEEMAARPGYIYTPGYYRWDQGGHKYEWSKGEYQRARPGEHWVAHNWVKKDGRYHFNEGHWDKD